MVDAGRYHGTKTKRERGRKSKRRSKKDRGTGEIKYQKRDGRDEGKIESPRYRRFIQYYATPAVRGKSDSLGPLRYLWIGLPQGGECAAEGEREGSVAIQRLDGTRL